MSNLDTPACCALALHLLMAEPIVNFGPQVARHRHGRLLPALVQVRGEAFVVVRYDNVAPVTSATFAADSAN